MLVDGSSAGVAITHAGMLRELISILALRKKEIVRRLDNKNTK